MKNTNYFYNTDNTRRTSQFTKAHLKTLKKHFDYVSRKEGIYFDRQVTNQIFKGGFLHVRGMLYRRIENNKKTNPNNKRNAIEEIVRIARKLSDQLRACGLKVKCMKGEDFYHWMSDWFNPRSKPKDSSYYPTPEQKPFGWNLTENIFFNAPTSFKEGWLFDGLPHKVITIQSLNTNPAIGHLTAERKRATDDKVFNLIDHLPEGGKLSLSIVFQAPSEVELHLKTIHDSAVGHHALAMKVKSEVETACEEMANGNYLRRIDI